jgi:outer membrane protein assembly factor BamB
VGHVSTSRSLPTLIAALGLSALAACSSSTTGAIVATDTARPADTAQLTGGSAPVRSGPADPAGWPEAIGNARHSSPAPPGRYGPRDGHLRWKRKLAGPVAPGPVVGPDGTVYAASNGGDLHALDPVTGADRWRFDAAASYGGDLSTSPALTPDGTLLWPGPHSTLFALRARDGRLLWTYPMSAQILSPALGPHGRAYLLDRSGRAAAIDPDQAGAHQAWTTELGEGSSSSPALAPDGTVVLGSDHQLTALADLGDHPRQLWQWKAPAQVEVSPAVAPDGTVVVGLNDPYVYGVRAGGTVWRFDKTDWSYSSAAATADGKVYLGDHTASLLVLDAATGKLIRRTRLPVPPGKHPDGVGVWTSPAVDAFGDAYLGTAGGHIYGIAPDGRVLLDIPTGGYVYSYPAIGPDGTVYIGSADSTLYAVGRPAG